MKTKSNRLLSVLMAVMMTIGLFAAMPMTVIAAAKTVAIVQSDTVAAIKTKIEDAINTSTSGDTVTVTGAKSGADTNLTLNMKPGVTLIWQAAYSGTVNAPNQLLYVDSSSNSPDTLEIAASGSVINNGTGISLYRGGYSIITRIDGTVKNTGGGVAIQYHGINITTLTVSGTVSASGDNPAIRADDACIETTVTVNGTVENTGSGSAIYAESGNVIVNGGFVFACKSAISGTGSDSVVRVGSGTPAISGNAVVCGWNKPSGAVNYTDGAKTNLNVNSAASVSWSKNGSQNGIKYANGTNTGFYPISGVTVNADAASSTNGPFRVTEHPLSATYTLNATAVPLKATFDYDTLAGLGSIDSDTPIRVQWYWSNENSNAGRINGFGESTVPYNRQIKHTTTLTPTTNAVGIKYYYAVITYAEAIIVSSGHEQVVPRETATNPARIEVVASKAQEYEVTVLKVDEDGNPLAGATIQVVSTDGAVVYDAVTDAKGIATFSVPGGPYNVSESKAPKGYNATGRIYAIRVSANEVYVVDPNTDYPDYPLTFVNKEIPALNKDDHFAFMQGYPEGTFGPARNMTRAEAVVMFSRLLAEGMNLSTNYYDSKYYPDLPSKAWYANQVCFMYNEGVLADYSRDGRFRGNDPVTRAEFATLAAHFDNLEYTDTNDFTDVPNSHWAVKYINSAAAMGWIVGYESGGVKTFKPEANITRAEVVTLVGRMLDRFADSAYLTASASSLPRDYSDLTTNHWAYLAIMEASTGHDYTRDNSGKEHWTAVYQ